VFFLPGEAFVAFTHVVVSDERVDVALGQFFEIVLAVKTQFQCRLT